MSVRRAGNAAHMLLGCALAIIALTATCALSRVRASLRYDLEGGDQALRIELRLLFGLWHRHWRVPEAGGRIPVSAPGRLGRAVQRQTVPGRRPEDPRPGLGASPAWRGLDQLRGRVRLETLAVGVELGVGDPALTALGVGAAHALLGAACAALPAYFRTERLRPAVVVRPNYGPQALLRARLDCLASTPLLHLALALAAAVLASRRAARG